MSTDAIYLRISEDREAQKARGQGRSTEGLAELNSSLAGQRRACRAKAQHLGAGAAVEFVDHDKSATQGRPREAYTALMRAIEAGQITRVIVLHMSRLWRNRSERARGIDMLRRHNVTIAAVRGPELDLGSAYGRLAADIFGAFDSAESEVKVERLDEWHKTRAERGLHNGPPPYGYRLVPTDRIKANGQPVRRYEQDPVTAPIVKSWYARLLAGEPIMSLAAEAGCHVTVMRNRLIRPTYAGLRVHAGAEYPMADIDPIVPVDVWRAAKTMLDGRRTGTNRGRTLLGGFPICERCDIPVMAGWGRGPVGPLYMCPNLKCHRVWRRGWLDSYADELVEARLGLPDVRGLLAEPAPGVEELLLEAQGIRARLRALATDVVLKGVDVSDAITAAKARLAEIERVTATANDPLAQVLAGPDPAGVYRTLPPRRRQAVMRALMTITLGPPPRGRWPYSGNDEAQRTWYVGHCVQIGPPAA